MGRKRESWNNYVRLFDLLVMQEEACPRLTPHVQRLMLVGVRSGLLVKMFLILLTFLPENG